MTIRIPFSTTTAIVAVVVMLVVAIGLGALAAGVARPAPSATPAVTPGLATATPLVDTAALVFEQPLSSGCASRDAIWVVSDGGGIGRFDGQKWQLVDDTLRSVLAMACNADSAIAVGPAGTVVIVDDRAKTIRGATVGFNDLYGISLLPDGALVVGSGGTVQRQSFGGWQPYADGIPEDLFGVVGFTGSSAWTVGSAGASYRLDASGWRPFPTGTDVTLRTVSGISPTDAIAAGDGGALLRFDGRWKPLDSGVDFALHASARAANLTYVVGDHGTVLLIDGANISHVDLGTTCAIRGVFTRSNEVWFVGSEGTRAGVWRRTGAAPSDTITRWGTC